MSSDLDEYLDQLRIDEREQLRQIDVRDLGTQPYEQGMAWIELRLTENATTGLKVNPRELADLRDRIDAYLLSR